MKQFLITGGAGFIGSAVIRYILDNTDNKVINIDKLNYASNLEALNQYNNNCIYFCEPMKNNIMAESLFIKILYSNYNVTFNGIYLLITLNDVTCEKYYTKYKCNFSIILHKDIIKNIKNIEEDLLKKYEIHNKTPQYKIFEQLQNGNFKIFVNIDNMHVCSFILKISGIWETSNNYGLTYKFVKIN